MNERFWLFGTLWIAILTSPLLAAEVVPHFPTSNSVYNVVIEYKGAEAPTGGKQTSLRRPVNAEVTLGEKLERYRLNWSDQQNSELWCTPQCVVMDEPGTGNILLCPRGGISWPVEALDSSLFSWIKANTYHETVVFENKKAIRYMEKGPGEGKGREALINPETLLPIAYETPMVRYQFKFGDRSPDSLVLPDRFQKEVAAYEGTEVHIGKPLGKSKAW